MQNYTFDRYLRSKKTVDDRALNKDVLSRLREELARKDNEVRVMEVGAGLGAMALRLLEWSAIRRAHYTFLDVDAEILGTLRQSLLEFAGVAGFEVNESASKLSIQSAEYALKFCFIHAELMAFLTAESGIVPVDLLIANSLLDLVDVPFVLPRLFDLVHPLGLYWFCVNFDGDTIFMPELVEDAQFLSVYHRSMDQRVRYGRRAGDSRTGRHLFEQLPAAGANILAVGASDWVVYPIGKSYVADEAYFLHHIVNTVEQELLQHPEIEATKLTEWTALRHAQIDSGQLVYVAHQLDFVGHARAELTRPGKPI